MTDTPPAAAPLGRPRTLARGLPHLLVAFSVLLFAWTIWEGRSLGLHRILPQAIDKHETSIAVAISDLRYGLDRGYSSYWKVHNTLRHGGMTDHPQLIAQGGLRYPDNLRDHLLMDRLVQEAANLPDVASGGVMYCPIFAEDVGYADFVKLGFRVFGYKLSALYSAYFLVMGVCLAAYLLAYRRDVPMLLLLVGFQLTFFLVVRSLPHISTPDDPSNALQLGSVINGRFLSTLGLIPFLHLAGAMVTWPRPTAGRVALGAVQAGVLGFALHLRGSAMWMFVALFGLAVLPGLAWAWRNRRGLLDQGLSARGAGRAVAARWALALVVLGLVGQKVYVSSAVHWTYQTDDGLPHHLLWHNALMALALHPRWHEQSLDPNPALSGDSMAIAASERLLDEHGIGKQHLISPLTHGYKARLHDVLCRQMYLKFARENPRYMAKLMFWYKPLALKQWTLEVGKVTTPGLLRPDALCMLAAFVGCAAVAGPRAWQTPLLVSGVGLAGAALPLMWAYPLFHVMSEFLMMVGLVSVFGAVAVARGGLVLSHRAAGRVALSRVRLPGIAAGAGR